MKEKSEHSEKNTEWGVTLLQCNFEVNIAV